MESSMRTLVVSINDKYKSFLKTFCEENDFECDSCENGKKAQESIAKKKYNWVFIDINVENYNFLQVVKFIKAKHPGVNVFLIMDRDKDEDLFDYLKQFCKQAGICENIRFPITKKGLLDVLSAYTSFSLNVQVQKTNIPSGEVLSISDKKFTRLDLKEFVTSTKAIFDLFIRLSRDKYIKIQHGGNDFDKETYHHYSEKFDYIYFLTEDRKKYIAFMNTLAKAALKMKNISSETKLFLVKGYATKTMEEIEHQGLNPKLLKETRDVVSSVTAVIDSNPKLSALLDDLKFSSLESYNKSFLISTMAAMATKSVPNNTKESTKKVVLACLFSDLGKLKLPERIREVDPNSLSDADYKLHIEHPVISVEMITELPMFDTFTKQLILQHHECIDKSGYPKGVSNLKIPLYAKIVSVSTFFVEKLIILQKPPIDTLTTILRNTDEVKKYDSLVWDLFTKSFVGLKNNLSEVENG